MHYNVQVYTSKLSNQVQYNVMFFFFVTILVHTATLNFLGDKEQQHGVLLWIPQIYITLNLRAYLDKF